MPSVSKKGGSSFANATSFTVRANAIPCHARARARSTATPLALSSAPGVPSAVS